MASSLQATAQGETVRTVERGPWDTIAGCGLKPQTEAHLPSWANASAVKSRAKDSLAALAQRTSPAKSNADQDSHV